MSRAFAVAVTCAALEALSCASRDRGPFVALAASGESRSLCFEQDADAAAEVLKTSTVLRFEADEQARFLEVFKEIRAPLFAYYAGHGTTGLRGETLGSSAWVFAQGATPPIAMRSILSGVTAPWIVILSASCFSAWTDVSRASVPASIISTSKDRTFEEPNAPVGSTCSKPSALGGVIVAALAGAADANADCLIMDEELAEYVNRQTMSWPRERRPELRVSRNTSRPLPVARLSHVECERSFDRMLHYASSLGGNFGQALRAQIALARGESVALPVAAERYYVPVTAPSPALEAAAARRGLRAFPGDLRAARAIARLASFTQLFELELLPNALRVTNPTTGETRLNPTHGERDLEQALPGCGTIEAVAGDTLYVRFDGAVPSRKVVARSFEFRADLTSPIPCSGRISGSCFRITAPPGKLAYQGDPIHCSGEP